MQIMEIKIIFIFLFLGWLDSATSRSAVKGRVKSNHLQSIHKKVNLDLSTDGPNPSPLISQIFRSTLRDLMPHIHQRRTVSVVYDITAPTGSRIQYLDNIEKTLRDILERKIPYPMQSFIRTKIQGNDDGTIATITITVSIVDTNTESKDFGSIDVDLSQPGLNIVKVLRTTLTIAVQDPSIRDNGDQSNNITLEIKPPQGFKKASIHELIGTIESILVTLLPDKEFSIKASISKNSGIITHISCLIEIGETTSQKNSFSFNIDMSKIKDGLDGRVIDILRNIQGKVEMIFNEKKPVFLNLKINPLPRSKKDDIIRIVETIMSTLRQIYPNRIEVTVNVYENSRRQVNQLILDVIIEPENAIEIDLNVPSSTYIERITYEVSKIKSTLEEPIDKSKSFTLILQPPANSDEKIIENITHIVISIISKIFPENEIQIQAKNTKDTNGYVSRITLVITLKPNKAISDRKENIININLSIPGVDLTQQIVKILPNLKTQLNQKHPAPVTLTLSIIPPEKSTESFIKKTLTTVLITLSDNFPRDKIKSEASVQEDPQGYLKNVKIVFTIIPAITLQKPKKTGTITITLKDPGSIESEIINILPQLNKLIETDQTVNLNLKIQPPPEADDKTVKNIVNSVMTTVSEKYPYNKLEFQVKVLKNQRGSIVNVNVWVTIEPADKNKTKPKVINLELKIPPGKTIVTEIFNIVPMLKNKITENKKIGTPSEIHLKIDPSKRVTSDYVKKTSNEILTILSQLYPQDQVSVKAKMKKDPQGKITEIILIINIDPKPEKPNTQGTKTPGTTTPEGLRPTTTPSPTREINLDLSKPGVDLTKEITTILDKINFKEQVGKTVHFTLNIQPPSGSNKRFVESTVNTIVTTLKTICPNDKIEVDLKISTDKNKTITNVALFLVISPTNINPKTETTTENVFFTTPVMNNLHEVTLDLSNPGSNITEIVTEYIINIKSEMSKNNPEDEQVTFHLNIQPPKGSTEEYVNKIVHVVMTTFSDFFPDKKVDVNLRMIKNPNGKIKTITMVLNIEPSSNTETSTSTTSETNEESTNTVPRDKSPSTPTVTTPMKITLDFSKPGTSLIKEIVNILPNINEKMMKEIPKGKTVQIEFNINPPDNWSNKSLNKSVKTIITLLKNSHPDNKIHHEVKVVRDKNDKIKNVIIRFSIEPSTKAINPYEVNLVTLDEPDQKTEPTRPVGSSTPTVKLPTKLEFNIEPGTDLIENLLTIIPEIEKKVNTEHHWEKPIKIELVMKPPVDSTEDTIKETSERILRIFQNKFPNKEIKISIEMNKVKNNIDNVKISVTIEPSSSIKTTSSNYFTTAQPKTETEENIIPTTDKTPKPTPTRITKTFRHSTSPDEVKTETVTAETRPSTTPSPDGGKYKEYTTPKDEATTFVSTISEQTKPTTSSSGDSVDEDTVGTKSPTESSTPTTAGDIVTDEYTTAENSTTSNKKIVTYSTSEPLTQKISTTVTPSIIEISTEGTKTPEKEVTEKTTRTQTESFITMPTRGRTTPKEYTSSEKSTPSHEETTEYYTSQSRTQKESSKVTPSKEELSTEGTTTPEEELTKITTKTTNPQKESYTTTMPTRGETTPKEYTAFEKSTPGYEETTKYSSVPTRRQTDSTTSTSSIEELFTEETNTPGNEITKITTRPLKELYTTMPTKGKSTPKEYTAFEKSTPGYEETTEYSTSSTRTQEESTISTPSTEELFTEGRKTPEEELTKITTRTTRPQKGSHTTIPTESGTTKEYTAFEKSTPGYKERTEYFTAATRTQKESTTSTPSKEEFSTEGKNRPDKEETKITTRTTRPQKESYTTTPAKGETTPKEYTAFEKSTPGYEETTEYSTSPTETQKESTTLTPSKEEFSTEGKNRPDEELTKITMRPQKESSTTMSTKGETTPKEYTAFEKFTSVYEETTEYSTAPTKTHKISTTPSTAITEISTEGTVRPEKEKTKITTRTQKELYTTMPTKGEHTPKEYTAFEKSTPGFEETTEYSTSPTRMQKELTTSTHSTVELSTEGRKTPEEEQTKITRPQKDSYTTMPTKGETTPKEYTAFEKSTSAYETTIDYSATPTRARKESTTYTPSIVELTTEGTTTQEEEMTETPAGREPTQKEYFTTPSQNENTSEESGEISKFVTAETRPRTESFTVSPTRSRTTPKEYTAFEEFTPETKKLETTPSGEVWEPVTWVTPYEITDETTTVSSKRDEITSTTPSKEEEKTVDIDDSRPGTDLQSYIEEIIPSIIPNIMPVLEKNHPMHLTFKIKPPNKSTSSYMKVTSEMLVNILSKFFPDEKISIQINGQKNPQGFLDEVTILVIIQPSIIQEPTIKKVDIDLSRPGSTLTEEIIRLVPSILPDVESELSKKSSVTINFRIKPPTGSTEDYLQTTVHSLGQILTKYFPENKITIQVNAQKNPQGNVSEITVYITIHPTTIQTPRIKDIDIDMSQPGVTMVSEINKVLPRILPELTKELNDNRPVSLSFKIKPRPGTTDSYLPVTTQVLESLLTQYFPKNKINVNVNADKNSQGYLTLIRIEISIEPPLSRKPEEDIHLDLAKPGYTLVQQVRDVIPSIAPDITKKLSQKLPVTLNFKVKPPIGSTESYLPKIIEPLENLLVTYWPNNKVNIQITTRKDPRGHLTEVTVRIILEPSPISTPDNVDIDLSQPGSSFINQVSTIMPGILTNINDNLSKQQPVTINFKIKPPTGSTENYLQVVTNSLQNILKNYFPQNEINIQISASKDPQGYISIVMTQITIQPPKKTTPMEQNVDIDLSRPGTNLANEVNEKLPHILDGIKEKLSNRETITINFKIRPPSRSTEDYLQSLGNSLLSILTNYFPENKIDVKMSAQKNAQGYISEVTIQIIIHPSLTTSPKNVDVDIDLTKPGVGLSNEMQKIIPTISQKITKKLESGHPVSMSFRIKPPMRSTDSYLQVITKSLQNILMENFPTNKISLEVSAKKDSQNYITEVIVEINLTPPIMQPNNDEDVDIDLSKPGSTLTNQIPQILPHILPNMTKDLSAGRPVTMNFKIKPPPRATESYLQVTAQTLETLLAQYFPGNAINVEISAQKNSLNQLTLITIQITVQPSPTQIPKKTNPVIDMTKPNVNLIDQVSQYLISVSPDLNKKIASGQPVSITLDIKPPYDSTDSYVQIIIQSIVPVLRKYFPNYKVNLETNAEKDSKGYITQITLTINIQPAAKPNDYNVDVDLMKSGFTLVEQVDNIIPNILQKVQNDLNSGESVTLNFRVVPPSGSRDDYLQIFTQDLVPILTKFFPGNRMSIQSNAEKNSEGFLINITVQITIQASTQTKNKIDIDLAKPGITLQAQVSNLLPQILPALKTDLSNGKPITLSFNVKPPRNSNRSFQNQIANQLVQILPQYFPNHRMSIQISSQEDGNGYISDILLQITIEP